MPVLSKKLLRLPAARRPRFPRVLRPGPAGYVGSLPGASGATGTLDGPVSGLLGPRLLRGVVAARMSPDMVQAGQHPGIDERGKKDAMTFFVTIVSHPSW